MAASIGVTDRTVSNYELDSTRAPKLVINHYALLTGVSVEWLLTGSDTDPATECQPRRPWRRVFGAVAVAARAA